VVLDGQVADVEITKRKQIETVLKRGGYHVQLRYYKYITPLSFIPCIHTDWTYTLREAKLKGEFLLRKYWK
jgi:hypothetical protein